MLTGSAPPSELLWSGDARPSILDSDGNQPRRDDQAVQGLRKRMCYELTLATSALYWTARYLAYARLVQLIADVGAAFQGKGGAGIFSEQQDSVAEMMVDSDGKVLSHYEFRRRLLELPGWEQFTALFLFFISEDDQLDIESRRLTSPRSAVPASWPSCATRSTPPSGRWRGWRHGSPRSAGRGRAETGHRHDSDVRDSGARAGADGRPGTGPPSRCRGAGFGVRRAVRCGAVRGGTWEPVGGRRARARRGRVSSRSAGRSGPTGTGPAGSRAGCGGRSVSSGRCRSGPRRSGRCRGR